MKRTILLRRKDGVWFVDSYDPDMKIIFRVNKIIKHEKTPFQEILILDIKGFGKCLVIDGITQSSEADEFIYHECLIHPAVLQRSNNESISALVLGYGEGATVRELVKYKNVKHIVAIDIDEKAVMLLRKYFPSMHRNTYKDPRVRIHFLSAIDYLQQSNEKFDFIFSDISDPSFFNLASSKNKSEIAFYKLIKKSLNLNGIFVSHAYFLNELNYHEHRKMLFAISKVFKKCFSMRVFVPFYGNYWSFILSTDDDYFNLKYFTENEFKMIIKHAGLGGKLNYLNCDSCNALFSLPDILQKKLKGISASPAC